jgi:hypothetical protein
MFEFDIACVFARLNPEQFQQSAQSYDPVNSPENLVVVRHITLNLLTQESTLKIGIKNKRLRTGWDQDYLLLI